MQLKPFNCISQKQTERNETKPNPTKRNRIMSRLTQILDDAINAELLADAELSGTIYPVDFDQVWQLLGYPNRSSAARCVIAQLIEGVDYIALKNHAAIKKCKSTEPLQKIMLTVQGCIFFAAIAKTEQGRNLRRYYVAKQCNRNAMLEHLYEAS